MAQREPDPVPDFLEVGGLAYVSDEALQRIRQIPATDFRSL
jgi:hypothetical protein